VSRHTAALVVALITTAAVSATALASGAGQYAKAKPGHYAGTTSEQGTVAFSVAAGGKRVTGFTTSDGYNRQCHFSGGVGGLGNFTVKVASMPVTKNGSFSGTAKETLGPFSGTFKVTGKLAATGARGTVTKVGGTCGSGASNPTTQDYLETFSAKHA
jgi:hypothetical protein